MPQELFAEDTGVACDPRVAPALDRAGHPRRGGDHPSSRPEILKLGKARIAGLLARDKSLAIYRQPLDEILRAAPHTLDAKGEAILATLGLAAGSAAATYEILASADLPWPKVKLADGREVTVDQASYGHLRELPDRGDRKKVFDAFWGRWKEYERTFGVTLLLKNLKQDSAYSKGCANTRTRSAAPSSRKPPLPRAVYDTLIAEIARQPRHAAPLLPPAARRCWASSPARCATTTSTRPW